MKDKEFDNFLRDKLSEMPPVDTGGFAAFEKRAQATKRRKVAFILVTFLLLFGGFSLVKQLNNHAQKQPEVAMPNASDNNHAPTNNEVEEADIPMPSKIISPENKRVNNVSVAHDRAASASSPKRKNEVVVAERMPAEAKEEINTTVQISEKEAAVDEIQIAQTAATENSIEHAPEDSSELAIEEQAYALTEGEEDFAENIPSPKEPMPNQNDVRETDKWSVTASVYPNFTFREFNINNARATQVHQDFMDIIEASERGGIAFNAGVDVRYHLGNNVFIGSGLAYIQTKITGNYAFDITNTPIIDGYGNITGYTELSEPVAIDRGIIQTFQYVQLPLHISYQPWVANRLRLNIEGGISFIRLFSASGATIDHQTLTPIDLESLTFYRNLGSFDFKVGILYYVNPQVAMGVEPTLMYFNRSLFEDDYPLYMVPWSVGVNFSVRMKLY